MIAVPAFVLLGRHPWVLPVAASAAASLGLWILVVWGLWVAVAALITVLP